MQETSVNSLTKEFRTINSELIKSANSSNEIDINSWVKKREAIVERIFDHLHEKAGLKKARA